MEATRGLCIGRHLRSCHYTCPSSTASPTRSAHLQSHGWEGEECENNHNGHGAQPDAHHLLQHEWRICGTKPHTEPTARNHGPPGRHTCTCAHSSLTQSLAPFNKPSQECPECLCVPWVGPEGVGPKENTVPGYFWKEMETWGSRPRKPSACGVNQRGRIAGGGGPPSPAESCFSFPCPFRSCRGFSWRLRTQSCPSDFLSFQGSLGEAGAECSLRRD